MSLEALVWALRVRATEQAGDAALRTLCILADYANDELLAWPSNETLMADRGVSRATLYRHLKCLHEASLILPGPSAVLAHIPANRRPSVWGLNAYGRGLKSETSKGSRGLTPQGPGVSSDETHKEEPRTYVDSNSQESPTRAREMRSTRLVEFPGRECVHGEPAVMWTDPKSGRRAPRCPLCRRVNGRIVLENQEPAHV